MVRFLVSCAGRFLKRQNGLSSVEYAVILGLVAVVLIGGATAVGLGMAGTFSGAMP